MTKRKLLSGQCMTRSDKKIFRYFEGRVLRGRRKYIKITRDEILSRKYDGSFMPESAFVKMLEKSFGHTFEGKINERWSASLANYSSLNKKVALRGHLRDSV